VPDPVGFASAAALPVAGVTALPAVRRLGSVIGRTVVITGAAGGVGRFAVKLAARAGAHVVASVGSPACGVGLVELGASEVVSELAQVTAPIYFAIDNVGGQLLADVLALVARGAPVRAVVRDHTRAAMPAGVEVLGLGGDLELSESHAHAGTAPARCSFWAAGATCRG
jgi:NADPH2:quinone reductase